MNENLFQNDDVYERSNLTNSQLLIWVGQKLNPQIPLYNMTVSSTIHGEIDTNAFQKAFQLVIQGSDALRTVFEEKDGIPRQRVQEEFPYDLEVLDFSTESDPDSTLKTWLDKRCQKIFNLQELLFDSALIKMDSDQYVWYLNQHHLITDAWSTSVIYAQMARLYDGALQHQLPSNIPLPPFKDFIKFERESRTSSHYKKALSYWEKKRSRLGDPTDFYGNTISEESSRTERLYCDLGIERTRTLKWIAQQKEFRSFSDALSLFTLFVSLLFTFLYRISGKQTVAIGTPAHNRPTSAFKETIGLFIEIFPLQVTIDPGETFTSLIKKVRTECNHFLLYALPGTSPTQSNNSVNVILNYIHASFPSIKEYPMKTNWIHSGHGDRVHSLRLQVQDFDESGTFLLHFDFNVDVFEEAKRIWARDQFFGIVDAFITNPSCPIDNIELLTRKQKQFVLTDYNRTTAEFDTKKTVLDYFDQQVSLNPNRPALNHNGREITYGDLNSQSDSLALCMKREGIGKGDVVGLWMKRSPELIIALLGVLKAGAAYVPIDASYPEDRVNFILTDTKARVVLTSDQKTLSNPPSHVKQIDLQKDDPNSKMGGAPDRKDGPTSEDLAYLIYTSGSTGKPKGVMIQHKSLLNYILWAKKTYLKGKTLDIPLFTSISFDLTVTSIFLPLISGGRLRIYDEDSTGGDLSVISVFEEDAVDMVKLTPSHLSLIKNLGVRTSRLKTFILGGEDLKCQLAQEVFQNFGGEIELYNEYGPTEATVGCMIHRFDPDADTSGSVPVGVPIDNMQIYILDKHLRPVPFGVVGEICISGLGVSQGYWQRETLSKEKFLDNPFGHAQKLYRSGDLARWNIDGQMEFLGRQDKQVKIKGARVEIAEVEEALINHKDIHACTVEVFGQKFPQEKGNGLLYCKQCGIPSIHPQITEIIDGTCNLCLDFEKYRDKAMQYFRPMDELSTIFERVKKERTGDYDCMMLLSGGKDSTYVLYQLVDMGLKVLAFSLDNGFISKGAKENIKRVAADLDVDLIFGKTPAMNSIFVDSLNRFSNVCNGCFKTIYTLSTNVAREKGINYIVTGLSRGQIFETRLADLFRHKVFDIEQVDHTILEARKAYHRMEDAVSKALDVEIFKDDKIFEEIQFIDFYRYCDTELDEMLTFLKERAPWIRPSDTGRSTNCLINELGIFIHKKERGYHNYALPYSWDVRLGHKKREAAMEELQDQITMKNVNKMLGEIGYDGNGKFTDTIENRLAAYYVAERPIKISEIRSYLTGKLPAYMIPNYFVYLEVMPLTANGKIDRAALPQPGERLQENSRECTPATTLVEKKLVHIWSEVLKIPEIGIHDNFFDLGGDSILNIQIVNKAVHEGLQFTPKQLFENQTVAELAKGIQIKPLVSAEQHVISGRVALTPIQKWFFEQQLPNPHHWNHTLSVAAKVDLDVNLLQDALGSVMKHHDMLRFSIKKSSTGWQQFIKKTPRVPKITQLDLSPLTNNEQDQKIETTTLKLNTSINIFEGDLLQVAYFHLGSQRKDRIVFTIHHLAVDGLSWSILLEDLQTAYQQQIDHQPIQLPPKTSSYKQWASLLNEYAQTQEIRGEVDYWLQQKNSEASTLPIDLAMNGTNTEISSHTVSTNLTREETQSLLQEVPRIYNTSMNDVLLTALCRCLSEWTNAKNFLIMLEGHGREEVIQGVQLSRTLGWFTSLFPVALEIQGGSNLETDLKVIKEQLRRIPNRGIGYGILRYLSKDSHIVRQLKSMPAPPILFHYLGQLDGMLSQSTLLDPDRELVLSKSPDSKRNFLLEINAYVFKGQLHVMWTYNANVHLEKTIERLNQRTIELLRSVLSLCITKKKKVYTPSDFPDADVDQEELDHILAEFGE